MKTEQDFHSDVKEISFGAATFILACQSQIICAGT